MSDFNFKIDAKTIFNKDEQTAMVEFYQVYDKHVQKLGSYIINAKEQAVRDALINLGWTPPEGAWQPIETAPKDEMFLYAKPNRHGGWGIGLAYNTISGTQVDHLSAQQLSDVGAMYWHPLPEPPK